MGLHPGMKVRTKTGKTARIVRVEGNHLYVKTRNAYYYTWRENVKPER